MKKLTIVLALFALILSACSSKGVKAEGETADQIAKISPSPSAAALEATVDPMIVFQRTGGFAGKAEKWSIYASGKIVQPSGAAVTIDSAKVDALMQAIQAAGFFEMKASAGIGSAANSCKDCFTYTLTVSGPDKTNTISVQDGAKNVPDAFWTLIKQINELIAAPTNQ